MDKSLDTFMTPILLILRILYCSDPTRDPLLSSRWYGADRKHGSLFDIKRKVTGFCYTVSLQRTEYVWNY